MDQHRKLCKDKFKSKLFKVSYELLNDDVNTENSENNKANQVLSNSAHENDSRTGLQRCPHCEKRFHISEYGTTTGSNFVVDHIKKCALLYPFIKDRVTCKICLQSFDSNIKSHLKSHKDIIKFCHILI